MKLKRTVSLLILAGMLSAGLASCVVDSGNELPTGNEGSYQQSVTTGGGNTPILPQNDPSKVTYTPDDSTVYITSKNAVLKLVTNTAENIQLGQLTELHRVGKS